MADSLDLGFSFTDHGGTLSYGWATDDSGSWQQRPGSADSVFANHQFYVSLFDLSETPLVELYKVEVTFTLSDGTISAPVVGWPASRGGQQQNIFTVASTGQQNGWSAGLQENGTGWSLGPFTFNTALLQQPCTYEVSINASAFVTGQPPSPQYTWSVDPELVIGGRG